MTPDAKFPLSSTLVTARQNLLAIGTMLNLRGGVDWGAARRGSG